MEENFFEKFTKEAKNALVVAQEKAQEASLSYVGTEHILIGILKQENSLGATILNNFGVASDTVELVLKTVGRTAAPKSAKSSTKPGGLSGFAKQVIEGAIAIAHKFNHSFVGTEHLLYSLVSQDNTAATVILENMKINPSHIKGQIDDIFSKTKQVNTKNEAEGNQQNVPQNPIELIFSGLQGVMPMNQAQMNQPAYKKQAKKTKSKTPTLDYFTTDLTEEARQGKLDPVIGRGEEIQRMISILNRKNKNNPVLIGEPGVGKTAIVEGLARMIAGGEAPDSIRDKKILSLSMGSVVAGTKYRGEFEERIKLIVEEAMSVPNIILFIDEIHTLIGAGSAEGSLDAANILKPALSRAKLQVIGATTTEEYRKSFETDAALDRRFQQIKVNEPSHEDAVQIIMGLRDGLEDHHNLMITDDAVEQAVELSSRYITDKFLPDKAIDLIDEACALKRVTSVEDKNELKKLQEKLAKVIKKKEGAVSQQNYEKAAELRDEELEVVAEIQELKASKIPRNKRPKINTENIAAIVNKITGIPVQKLISSDMKKLKNLEKLLHESIIGQENAVSEVAKAIRRSRAGISDQNRPNGSFLFLGPTGVGKTELVKTIAREVFDDEKALIKIDMSEFMEKHASSRLTGTTAGYVGYEDGGQLTEAVRRKPYSVILFDEVEKAHPDFFNLLLQILEDGVLTDGKGRKIDFKNTIIVMTSNIGAKRLTNKSAAIGFNLAQNEEDRLLKDFEKTKTEIMGDVKKHFKPEFLNRIDKIIIFDALTHDNVKEIVSLLLEKVQKRLKKQDITLNWSDGAVDVLASVSYEREYGARPARRKIQEMVEDEVANMIIDGDLKQGQEVKVGKRGNELSFKVVD
jgi:ATP-dependent Clp protease ATP-binding subunit ClpC